MTVKRYHFRLTRCIKSDQGLISLYVNYNELVGTKENCDTYIIYIYTKSFQSTQIQLLYVSFFTSIFYTISYFPRYFRIKIDLCRKEHNNHLLSGVSENLKI